MDNVFMKVLEDVREKAFASRSEECLELLISAEIVARELTIKAHDAGFMRGPFFVSKKRGHGGPTFIVATQNDVARLSGIIGSAKLQKEGYKNWYASTGTRAPFGVIVRISDVELNDEELPPELCVNIEAVEEMRKQILASEEKPKKKNGKKKKEHTALEVEPAMPRDL